MSTPNFAIHPGCTLSPAYEAASIEDKFKMLQAVTTKLLSLNAHFYIRPNSLAANRVSSAIRSLAKLSKLPLDPSSQRDMYTIRKAVEAGDIIIPEPLDRCVHEWITVQWPSM